MLYDGQISEGDVLMIKEWLLKQILRNRIVLFEHEQEYTVINDIYFDDGVMICKKTDMEDFE